MLYNTINDGHDPKKIVQSCDTRWLSVAPALRRIDTQHLELKVHFGVARNSEKCYTAEILYEMYNDRANVVYIKFLLPILKEVERVNFSFESNESDPTVLLDDITLLIKFLVTKITLTAANVDPLDGNIDNALDPKPYLGYQFETEMGEMARNGYPADREAALRSRCINFLRHLISQLRQRLPDNVKILQKIDKSIYLY